MEFPLIGGFAFGVILAVVIEVLKALRVWNEGAAPWVNIIGGVIWVALVLVIGQFPAAQMWIIWVLRLIVTLAGVPIMSQATYRFIVKPVVRKRFNTYDRTM